MSLIACLSALIQQIILETLLASLSLFPLGCSAAPRQSLSHQIVLYHHTNISSKPKRKTRQMTKWLLSFALKILNFKENFNKYLKMCRFVFILTSVLALAGVHLSGKGNKESQPIRFDCNKSRDQKQFQIQAGALGAEEFRASQSSRVGLALPAHLAGRAGAESPQVAALSPEASPFYYSLCVFVGL